MKATIDLKQSMKSETNNSETKLRPDAPIYVPITKNPIESILQQFSEKEPQCSRYSRKTIRRIGDPNGPRPILGTKLPFPRPILGRKEDDYNDEDNVKEYLGKEFRSISRKMQKMKIDEDDPKNHIKRKTKS